MRRVLRQLFAPSGLWAALTMLALGGIAIAIVVTPTAEPARMVDNPLVYANGESVPKGRWSVLCIDGVAYLQIASPPGHAVVPKRRGNGLVERCAPPEGE
jgi:hypothetical protein